MDILHLLKLFQSTGPGCLDCVFIQETLITLLSNTDVVVVVVLKQRKRRKMVFV